MKNVQKIFSAVLTRKIDSTTVLDDSTTVFGKLLLQIGTKLVV